MRKTQDITGQVFGLLTAARRDPTPGVRPRWFCVCECGVEKVIDSSDLRKGSAKSCGCASSAMISAANTTHGMSRTRVYRMWAAMLNRCKDTNKAHYGGRGISVCDRWRDFTNFYADMGDPPKGMSIDRINNDEGYYPENCRWATPLQQTRNRSISICITADGITATLYDHAQRIGMRYDTLYYRIVKRGWDPQVAVSTPVGGNSRR